MKNCCCSLAALIAAVLFPSVVQLQAQAPDAGQPPVTPSFSSELKPLPVLTVMQRVADWELAHSSITTNRPATGWVQAAGDAGFMALAGISGDAKYRDAMLAQGRDERLEAWPGPQI
jgi:unsaturated rhamnogalacturonyl hydrolase